MLWIAMLFTVGLCGAIGFYDRVFGFSDMMRYINSGMLVILSMGLLVRTWILSKYGKNEKLMSRIAELEKMLGQAGQSSQNDTTKEQKATASQPY
ncbi:MAG: hypothetical protein V3W18_07630 [candidate division Zixibacteria bacterium]